MYIDLKSLYQISNCNKYLQICVIVNVKQLAAETTWQITTIAVIASYSGNLCVIHNEFT